MPSIKKRTGANHSARYSYIIPNQLIIRKFVRIVEDPTFIIAGEGHSVSVIIVAVYVVEGHRIVVGALAQGFVAYGDVIAVLDGIAVEITCVLAVAVD